jgi:hypothetical protein
MFDRRQTDERVTAGHTQFSIESLDVHLVKKLIDKTAALRDGLITEIDFAQRMRHFIPRDLNRNLHTGQTLEGRAKDFMSFDEPVDGVFQNGDVEWTINLNGTLRPVRAALTL